MWHSSSTRSGGTVWARRARHPPDRPQPDHQLVLKFMLVAASRSPSPAPPMVASNCSSSRTRALAYPRRRSPRSCRPSARVVGAPDGGGRKPGWAANRAEPGDPARRFATAIRAAQGHRGYSDPAAEPGAAVHAHRYSHWARNATAAPGGSARHTPASHNGVSGKRSDRGICKGLEEAPQDALSAPHLFPKYSVRVSALTSIVPRLFAWLHGNAMHQCLCDRRRHGAVRGVRAVAR